MLCAGEQGEYPGGGATWRIGTVPTRPLFDDLKRIAFEVQHTERRVSFEPLWVHQRDLAWTENGLRPVVDILGEAREKCKEGMEIMRGRRGLGAVLKEHESVGFARESLRQGSWPPRGARRTNDKPPD